jgi:thioredoxin 1
MQNITKETFEDEVINSSITVVVDFMAAWCVPCKTMTPLLESLATEYQNIKFVKVDADNEHDIVSKYKISGVPVLLIFKDGEMIKKIVGLQNKRSLKEIFDTLK